MTQIYVISNVNNVTDDKKYIMNMKNNPCPPPDINCQYISTHMK